MREWFFDLISGKNQSLWARGIRVLLKLLSWLMAILVWLRIKLYRFGIKKSYAFEQPILCVGNISTGGTGKTPCVALLYQHLRNYQPEIAVISRGYKGVDKSSNDEAKLLERNFPDLFQIQDPNRVRAVQKALRQGKKLMLLDDGFSHLRIKRSLDLVLIDALCPFGYGHLLPRGLLREPLKNLRRAQLIMITRCDSVLPKTIQAIEQTLAKNGIQPENIFHAEHKTVGIQPLENIPFQEKTLLELKNTKVAAFSGIGNPLGFRRTLESLGTEVVYEQRFEDHFSYDPIWLQKHWGKYASHAQEAGADMILITEKDGVKLEQREFSSSLPIYQLQIKMQIREGIEKLHKKLQEHIALPDFKA